MYYLGERLPGLAQTSGVEDKKLVHCLVNEPGFPEKRLGNPDYYRFYFSFTLPSGSISESGIQEVLRLLTSQTSISEELKRFVEVKRHQGGTMLEPLIDRLRQDRASKVPDEAIVTLLASIADIMDQQTYADEESLFGSHSGWAAATKLTAALFSRLKPKDRMRSVRWIFKSGKALGWICHELLRSEIVAHGTYGASPKPKSQWILTEAELNVAIKVIRRRLKSNNGDEVIQAPDVLSILYLWSLIDKTTAMSEWIERQIKTNEGLVQFLMKVRGWMMSDRVYHPLNRQELTRFFDFDSAMVRVKALADPSEASGLQHQAQELLQAAAIGRGD